MNSTMLSSAIETVKGLGPSAVVVLPVPVEAIDFIMDSQRDPRHRCGGSFRSSGLAGCNFTVMMDGAGSGSETFCNLRSHSIWQLQSFDVGLLQFSVRQANLSGTN
jgi:hypothetical protein